MATNKSTGPVRGAAFTTRTLEGLLAQAKKRGVVVERGDSHDYKGLRFRALPNGKRATWFYRFRDGDRLRMHRLGEYPTTGLEKARADRQRLESLRREGKPLDGSADGAMTFGKVLNDYQGVIRDTTRDEFIRSWREVTRALDADARRVIGDMPIADVGRTNVRALLHEVGVERGSPRQANRLLAYVRRVFNWALETERYGLEANPCAAIRRPHAEIQRENWLKAADVRRFVRKLPDLMVGAPADVLLLMLRTGQRKGEIAGMGWSELELDGDAPVWHLPAERAKNKRAHDVPLPSQAVAIIKRWRERTGDTDHVFLGQRRSKGRPVRGDVVNEAWARVRDGLKLSHIRPHDLRHTAMTHLARMGCPKPVRERIANHVAPGSTADRYDHHSYDAEAREWLVRWNDEIDRIAEVNVVTLEKRA